MARNNGITKKKSKSTNKKKFKFSKIIVVLCIVFIIIYTIIQTICSIYLQIEITPTLTTCVYAFFGTELAATAIIRIFDKEDQDEMNKRNRKNNTKSNSEIVSSSSDNSVG